ncbi:hypothetical protein EYC80_010951 [Monilinia laxa]|uniref:N-glycosylation protein EOS1 n=1 Tax=Monilinia laxa TaxID=61186 RepID=A0A5N6JR44_MONLA|nr:hypothetical protein EYC80_010951 [Monilinia laxa]
MWLCCGWLFELDRSTRLKDNRVGGGLARTLLAPCNPLPFVLHDTSKFHQKYFCSYSQSSLRETLTHFLHSQRLQSGSICPPFPTPPSEIPSTTISPSAYQPNLHPADPEGKTSVLHPRVAVLLGVARVWHFPLLFCRLLSIAPAIWWGLRCALTFMRELLWDEMNVLEAKWTIEKRIRVTEVFLAILWVWTNSSPKCFSSAYLAFFFTDCLMSRWLLNYAPQATIVRLLTINLINAYTTSWILYLSGGSEDPRLLLPAWICIASTLTFLYHMTHPRLAIRKETSLSISVFSIASFISMVSLLSQLYLSRTDLPPLPLIVHLKEVWGYVKLGFRLMA